MDTFLVLIGFLFAILGLIGSFLPILPGPITGWVGLLLLHLTKAVPNNSTFLIITFVIALFIFIIDYFIPAMGTKRFGGSKYGAYGTTIGLIIGLLSPIPFGILIGAFLGALVGELLYDSSDGGRAIKASFGAFLGFLVSVILKFTVSATYFVLFLTTFWEFKHNFWG